MFESDDFDQVLSQFDFPDLSSSPTLKSKEQPSKDNNNADFKLPASITQPKSAESKTISKAKNTQGSVILSPKHTKRKIINSFFDSSSKRKFPGPAGLLTGSLEESKDDGICQMELLSQDIDFSQNNKRCDILESPLWIRLQQDASSWQVHIGSIDNIKSIKQQAHSGNLRRRKAQAVTAFVEAVDRSATDPLVILRDSTVSIKCTLHRDAWCAFSPYIVAEYSAFILIKPTVLTTGSAFKKHYLNITLSNIFAIYSSAVLNDEDRTLPDGYRKVYEEDFTVIKTDRTCNESGFNVSNNESMNAANDDLLDGLDSSIFLDEIF